MECTYSLSPNGCRCIIRSWRFLSALHASALFRPGNVFDANSEWTTLLVRQALITPPRRQMHNILRCSSGPRASEKWRTLIRLQSYPWSDWFRTRRRRDWMITCVWLLSSCLGTRKQFHDIRMENINCSFHSSALFRNVWRNRSFPWCKGNTLQMTRQCHRRQLNNPSWIRTVQVPKSFQSLEWF